MDQIIKHITERLVHQLPEEKEAFKLNDLQEYGFPRFVVRRIQIELERNLAESIILPETEWADMESEEVQHAWDQFVGAIRAQALLPQSYVQPVTETAINDIMEILVQPRKNLPDVIYGASDSLEYSDLADRVDSIVVYRHFSSLIPRYMEKKELDELTKEWCSKIITQADEKLTAHYSPLNWAQMLEPLFVLTEEQIDSNLLRLFFEDKNKPRLARRFDMINDSLNRSELIEVLSTPDLKDDDEQNELFNPQVTPPNKRETETDTDTEELKGTVEQEDISIDTVSDTDAASGDTEDAEKQPDDDDNKEDNDGRGNFLNAVTDESEEMAEDQEEIQVDEETSANALNEIFSDEDPENGDEYSKISDSFEELENKDDGTERVPKDNEEPEKGAVEEDQDNEEDKEETDNRTVIAENDGEAEEETPMWQRFMGSSDIEVEEEDIPEETPEHRETEDEEEPLIDLTKQDEPDEEIYNQLFDLLEDERNRFVEEIFRGGDEAYEEAIKEIATKENWREASQFIEKEVFKRNLVDMYSEVAVDFTDRLQTYFIKTTKSN